MSATDDGNRNALDAQVLRGFVLQTLADHDSELVVDSFSYVEPVLFGLTKCMKSEEKTRKIYWRMVGNELCPLIRITSTNWLKNGARHKAESTTNAKHMSFDDADNDDDDNGDDCYNTHLMGFQVHWSKIRERSGKQNRCLSSHTLTSCTVPIYPQPQRSRTQTSSPCYFVDYAYAGPIRECCKISAIRCPRWLTFFVEIFINIDMLFFCAHRH